MLKKAIKKIKNIDADYSKDESLEGMYVFFSFDLVNSTSFKSKTNGWASIFSNFFETCKINMLQQFPEIKPWKKAGDEILFYLAVRSADDLPEIPRKTFTVLSECAKDLEENNETKAKLSVKATLWGARAVEFVSNDDKKEYSNVIIKEISGSDSQSIDFLGPDIDIGFRIAKFSLRKIIVIDAKLACLIVKQKTSINKNNISENMRIVSYEQLKGVWDGRFYPIVWYSENWENMNTMFLYDEKFYSSIVKKIEDTEGKSLEQIGKLTKIFEDLDKLHEIENLEEGIKIYAKNNPSGKIQKLIDRDKLSELHVVAVCFNAKNEILCAKRTEKDIASLKWEFGCSQLRIGQKFIDAIKTDYKSDFNIDVDFFEDSPLPIKTFEIIKENEGKRLVPGLCFVCKITSDTRQLKCNPNKHSEIKWINKENYKCLKEEGAVPDFEDTIKAAFAYLDKILDKIPNSTTKI